MLGSRSEGDPHMANIDFTQAPQSIAVEFHAVQTQHVRACDDVAAMAVRIRAEIASEIMHRARESGEEPPPNAICIALMDGGLHGHPDYIAAKAECSRYYGILQEIAGRLEAYGVDTNQAVAEGLRSQTVERARLQVMSERWESEQHERAATHGN